MPRSQCEKENAQLVRDLAEVDGPFESPININFRDLIKVDLPPLCWNKTESIPKKMKITNTGHTVIISGKWKCERPYLTGGPLDGKYVFSQIHFHWGPDNCRGSEHQVCGESFPLEMHVAHFKTEYMTQEAALREKDGMVVVVYLFKLQEEPNNSLRSMIQALPLIKHTNSCHQMDGKSILAFCNPFTDDYFMYWGSVVTSTCAHILLWFVCREPFGISRQQVEEFRTILDSCNCPIRRNSRDPQPLHKRNVFHVNASKNLDQPMLPIKNVVGCFCNNKTMACAQQGDDFHKSEGDYSGCNCYPKSGAQEDFEDRQDPDRNRQTGMSGGNNIYLEQSVYYHHSSVHPLSVNLSPAGKENEVVGERMSSHHENREISHACCFQTSDEERRRERLKNHRRKTIDSVTALTNLIKTLESLKLQTYKKLKEIESINHEIRGMRTSCENLQEQRWLRQAEKIMTQQKRFTIRSSQCCFNELKKLAKECNFDKLLNDKAITDSEGGLLLPDDDFLCSKASGDAVQPLNKRRFSRKAHKLIRSFFEDIKESEETQANLERNLSIKKSEKLSSNHSTPSSGNVPNVYVTKKMMNTSQIRNQFFTEVPEEKPQAEVETTNGNKKKKTRSFFKIRLAGFEDESSDHGNKMQSSLFTNAALAWFSRLSAMNDSSPFISLRLRDIEFKGRTFRQKNKSKESIKAAEDPPPIQKTSSDEPIRTDVSSCASESFASDMSGKHSDYSKQSLQARDIMGKTSDLDRKSELSVKLVKKLDGNNYFIQISHPNILSATSTETEKRSVNYVSGRTDKEMWEKDFFYTKVDAKGESEVDLEKLSSTDSSSTLRQPSKTDVIMPCQWLNIELESSKDGEVDVQNVNSPKRKRLRLDGKTESSETEPEPSKAVYIESECQTIMKQSMEECNKRAGLLNETECQTEIPQVQAMKDTSVEANIPLPTSPEDTPRKNRLIEKSCTSEDEGSSILPKKSSDTMSDLKDFPFGIKQKHWLSMQKKDSSAGGDHAVETQTLESLVCGESIKEEEVSVITEREKLPMLDLAFMSAELTCEPLEVLPELKIQSDSKEFSNIFTTEGSPYELSEFDYDLRAESIGTMICLGEKSRESTMSSSDGEKDNVPTESSVVNTISQQKPFSAESINSFNDDIRCKKRQGTGKKSKAIGRKSKSRMRKLGKIGGSNIDFTNLTEEEQLRIISAKVAKFVKQKLVEHRQFFDFTKTENINFDVEEWSKPVEEDPSGDGEEEIATKKEEPDEESPAAADAAAPEPKLPGKPTPALSPAGDSEKIDKIDIRRHPQDFVKRNKIMAGKYKRGPQQDASKLGNKKGAKKDPPKLKYPKTVTTPTGNFVGKEARAPSGDSPKSVATTQKGRKSDIPILQRRKPALSPRVNKLSASARSVPPAMEPTPNRFPQKPKPPRKRLVPTYTLTSYLPAPNEVMQYQQREFDKYLTETNRNSQFFDEINDRYSRLKKNDNLPTKNLDYLIMLQKSVNRDLSANKENSMSYVQTLLGEDCSRITEIEPSKSTLQVFEPGIEGIVLIEMNEQIDTSSSTSDESGFYCIYQGRSRREKGNIRGEIIVKRKESRDSGLVDTRQFEEFTETDSSWNRELSIIGPDEEEISLPGEVSDVLKKYIYHLGGSVSNESVIGNGSICRKPKKRRDRVLDLPQETKRKLLDELEGELRENGSDHGVDTEEDLTRNEEEIDGGEMISKIRDMVKLYLHEYDRTQASDKRRKNK